MTPFRAVEAEVTQKMNDEETKVQWAVELKQLLTNSKTEAKKEFELFSKEYSFFDGDSTTAPPSRRTKGDLSDGSEESKTRRRRKPKRRDANQSDCSDEMDGKLPGKRQVAMTRLFGVWRGVGFVD